ncbi:unnamed protein product [Prorocentrum cordatum]|uniref:Uncharacterized protein n=1 Tax=Prorocentrum cordatum TaxID=2364126 RepID=A0ABN9X1Z5_9DINO|nr:unnamed protein product [Polarella glacialis]
MGPAGPGRAGPAAATLSLEYGPPRPPAGARLLPQPLGTGARGCAAAYGAAPAVPAPALQRRGRRRIDVFSVAAALFLPWALFCAACAVVSFSLRYQQPVLARGITGLLLLPVAVAGVYSVREITGMLRERAGRATWAIFLFLAMLLAWTLGVQFGNYIYTLYLRPFYDIDGLHAYAHVDPSKFRGQQLMDAGRIVFTRDARLDVRRSMGFKNQDTYCAAPITVGNENVTFKELPSYDFWAVGLNCCGEKGDFTCGEYNNPDAHAGLRLMRDDQRKFFRLAVQQAESAFNIKSVHPVFVHFMQDPLAEALSYQEGGLRCYFVGLCLHFLLQLSLVAVAVALFQRLDSQTATLDQGRGGCMQASAKTVLL